MSIIWPFCVNGIGPQSDVCITVLEVVKVDFFFGLAHFLEKEHASTQL